MLSRMLIRFVVSLPLYVLLLGVSARAQAADIELTLTRLEDQTTWSLSVDVNIPIEIGYIGYRVSAALGPFASLVPMEPPCACSGLVQLGVSPFDTTIATQGNTLLGYYYANQVISPEDAFFNMGGSGSGVITIAGDNIPDVVLQTVVPEVGPSGLLTLAAMCLGLRRLTRP